MLTPNASILYLAACNLTTFTFPSKNIIPVTGHKLIWLYLTSSCNFWFWPFKPVNAAAWLNKYFLPFGQSCSIILYLFWFSSLLVSLNVPLMALEAETARLPANHLLLNEGETALFTIQLINWIYHKSSLKSLNLHLNAQVRSIKIWICSKVFELP